MKKFPYILPIISMLIFSACFGQPQRDINNNTAVTFEIIEETEKTALTSFSETVSVSTEESLTVSDICNENNTEITTSETTPEETEEETASQPETSAEVSLPEKTVSYVLNTNTNKFHRPDCSSVPKIKESNREDFTGSREEVIEMGYKPCKICDP